jgi:DNA-binding LacI/PurR family transcriptional regulator
VKPTIGDVATAAGVSRASVSFAFNRPGRVADATLQRILEVAAELGYVPDPVARSMSSGRTGTVGILVPQPLASMAHNPFFSEFLSGVATVTESGELPILLVSPRQGSMERAVHGAAVDAFLTLGLEEFRPTIQMLEARHLPFVMVDSEPVDGIACVNSDDIGGAYQAMNRVLNAGHRRIGILGIRSPHPGAWRRYTGTLARRIEGYRQALNETGLDIDDVTLVESKMSERPALRATQRLLDRTPDVTAIVSMSDIGALGALEAAAARNLKVPSDLSIVGFDGIPEARWSQPALTTISQNPAEKGKIAAEMLVGLINGTREPEHLILATTPVKGQTIAPPP